MYSYSDVIKRIGIAYNDAKTINESECKVYFANGKDLYMFHISWSNKLFVKIFLVEDFNNYLLIKEVGANDITTILSTCRELVIEYVPVNLTL